MSQAELLSPAPLSPSVSLHSGRPATTSLEVAKFFGKRHDGVLRDVRRICPETPEDFRVHNFVETFRTIPGPNNSERQETYFILYRDGFMLLVMGYTGKKALAMKLAYIEAFNRMEAELAARSRPLAEDMVLPEPELPAAERLPLFRNGCFYLPGINKNHVPGPREAALMDLWQTWNRQTASMEREFMSMMRELERRRGDLFAVAVSELGRDADTAFSFESLMEGLFCAHDMVQRYFKEAIALQRLSIRLSVNVAVALGR
ncbi:Rha family transcriptional regulator [uncultured Desulfovibrio sp.]|uniref:Rha family transcriptional regulator n=1 Tax=uncultured Desulfovibrio sp. TaxID=167968 RepID=UPI002631A381|nr:Rha family transcriptional regulator [uncultured Desulfovibrio sp.]